MTGDRHPATGSPIDTDEHYVVSLEAFNAMSNLVDALDGIAALTAGKLSDADPEVSRNEVAAVFWVISRQLDGHLRALPHRASRRS